MPGSDDCERCGDPVDAGHYVELEWPAADGIGRIAGSLCDGCAADLAGRFPRRRPSGRDDYHALECGRCGHEWTYTGGLEAATCPSCRGRVPVESEAT